MTLLQLKYVLTVAAAGTISEAAKRLYLSQPSLTSAVRELEAELGICIFHCSNKGIVLSAEGEEFLGYARQVIEQTNLIEEKYFGSAPVKHQFCVPPSTIPLQWRPLWSCSGSMAARNTISASGRRRPTS